MKTFLVTGGCGFVGSHFVRLIFRERPDCRVINVDLLTYAGNLENLGDQSEVSDAKRYRFVRADIADSQAINAVFASETIAVIVNFAAETHVDRSLLDSATFLRTNVEGTRVLLEAASRHKVGRFLQVSTDEVYGSLGPLDAPFTESSPLQPNSPYAASKAAADLLIRAYVRSYDVPVVITRCSNNYGPYQFPEKFLPLFITNALDDQPLPLYGDGQQIRDWIHVDDHASALLRALDRGSAGEIYNISAGQEETNERMAFRVLDLLGKPQTLIRYVEDRPGHDRRYALDATKIENELGWKPTVSLENGLQATFSWYRDHRSWWQRIKTGEYRDYYARWYGKRFGKDSIRRE
jgi:dTDP-glucose 4,6-dehydratase